MSKVWTDVTKYSWLHKELKGETARAQAEKSSLVNTQKGQVKQSTVRLTDNKSKIFMWGPLNGVAHLDMPAVMWIECTTSTTGCTAEVLDYIKENPSVALICVGDHSMITPLIHEMESSLECKNQSISLLYVGVDKAAHFTATPHHHRDHALETLLCTSKRKMNPHYTVLTIRGLGWRTSLIEYCLDAMGMTMGTDYDQNIVYVPHSLRTPDEVMERVAYLLAVNKGLSVSLVPPTYLPPDENTVTGMLTSSVDEMVNNESVMKSHETDLKIFHAGKTLDANSANYKTDRDMRDDLKKQMSIRRKLVQQKLDFEERQEVSGSDYERDQEKKHTKKKRGDSSTDIVGPSGKDLSRRTAKVAVEEIHHL